MYRISYSIIFVVLLLSGCSSYNIKNTPHVTRTRSSDFIALLECFETFCPSDTLADLSEKLFFTDPCHSSSIDSGLIYIVNPTPPFFKMSPSIKVKCKDGWYVFLVLQYEVANIELKYIDIISFDFNGNIVNRMNLPYTDAHGGLYYNLDERYSSQGEIAISKDYLEYTWYYMFDNQELADTLSRRYKILPDGSMIQVAFEENKK